jgi:hypothetical protein
MALNGSDTENATETLSPDPQPDVTVDNSSQQLQTDSNAETSPTDTQNYGARG